MRGRGTTRAFRSQDGDPGFSRSPLALVFSREFKPNRSNHVLANDAVEPIERYWGIIQLALADRTMARRLSL